jgi:hypothetical protein
MSVAAPQWSIVSGTGFVMRFLQQRDWAAGDAGSLYNFRPDP